MKELVRRQCPTKVIELVSANLSRRRGFKSHHGLKSLKSLNCLVRLKLFGGPKKKRAKGHTHKTFQQAKLFIL